MHNNNFLLLYKLCLLDFESSFFGLQNLDGALGVTPMLLTKYVDDKIVTNVAILNIHLKASLSDLLYDA